MYALLHEHISNFEANGPKEFGAFPVLIILAHLYPSTNLIENYHLNSFIPGILNIIFGCVNQKLKEMAAAALLSISLVGELERVLDWIQRKCLNHLQSNRFVQSSLTLLNSMQELHLFDVNECLLTRAQKLLERFADSFEILYVFVFVFGGKDSKHNILDPVSIKPVI